MKYVSRKNFRYGNKIYLVGQSVPVDPDDVSFLIGQGKIGAGVMETAMVEPVETAMKPPAEPKKRKTKKKVEPEAGE